MSRLRLVGKRHDKTRVEKIINFMEAMKVPEGKLAGQPFRLIQSQRDFLHAVYGPTDEDGLRLVKEAIFTEPRKNGKSTFTAALMLTHLTGPECRTPNAQLYSAAQDREQASLVFRLAMLMARSNPRIAGEISIMESRKTMKHRVSGATYVALSAEAKTKFGFSTSFCVFDELAQAGADRRLYDALRTSSGAQEEFLFIVISTQAADDSAVLSELIDYAAEGTDPTIHLSMFAAPADADIFDEKVWLACNPALGIYRSMGEMREMATRAKRLPGYEGTFRNLYLNQRTAAEGYIVSPEQWKANGRMPIFDPTLDWYGGLDLSTRLDLTAFTIVSLNADLSINVISWFWTPGDTLPQRAIQDRAPYDKWHRAGYLTALPGTDIDYEQVVLKIDEIQSVFNVQDIYFDRARIEDFNRDCAKQGVSLPMTEYGQGYVSMNPAVEAFEVAVTASRLRHGGNPVLTQSIFNTVYDKDPAGNRKPTKKRSRGRIDGFTSLAMALRALGVEEVSNMNDPDYELLVIG